jgi:hypothetical protein
LLTLLDFNFYKEWALGEPKFNLSCEELSRTKAFFQDKDALGARRTEWSNVINNEPPISGFVGSFAQCEFYNLQSATISIREIVNAYYYDRFFTNELPNFREFFDTEKTNRLMSIPSNFPITVAPGAGFKFTSLFLFPVGNLALVKDERCQNILRQELSNLREIGYCVEKLHGKPLVNLLYEGQGIGLGTINSIGLMIVLGDKLTINYKPSMQYMPFYVNDKFERTRSDRYVFKDSSEEVWATYPEERNYVRVGNQYIRLSFWSVLLLVSIGVGLLSVVYLIRNAVSYLISFVRSNKKSPDSSTIDPSG